MKTIWTLLILFVVALIFRPAAAEANSGDFSGGVVIGTGYAGANTAPPNGLIVQGNVGIGTASPRGSSVLDVDGALNANSLTLNQVPMLFAPSGRLTLSSTSPVMSSDVVNATTIYYLPYVGQNAPIYNGTQWIEQDIGSSGLSLTLNTTNMPTNEVFDVYASLQSGNVTLCSLYWGGNTARSSTAGGKSGSQDARIVQLNGLWVNQTAIAASNCYNNTTAYTIAQNQGTYLGTFFSSAAGQTEWVCHPAAASGGGSVDMALYNVYNQKSLACENMDNGAIYAYSTQTPRISRNSTANENHWLDGLGMSSVSAVIRSLAGTGTSTIGCYAFSGAALNSTTTPILDVSACGLYFAMQTLSPATAGVLGYNFYVPMESCLTGATCSWNAGGSSGGFTNNAYLTTTMTVNGI